MPAPDPATTASLLASIRGGDDSAWNPLLARFQGRLRLYVHYRLGQALAEYVEVEDILQETWIRALGAAQDFRADGENAFYRFLKTLACNTIADVARAARAKKRGGGRLVRLDRSDWSRNGIDGVADATAGPLTRLERSEKSALMERAFDRLPPHHRRVIALRQLEQLPAREVARRMGSTEGAIHALYRRALSAWGRAYEGLAGASSV